MFDKEELKYNLSFLSNDALNYIIENNITPSECATELYNRQEKEKNNLEKYKNKFYIRKDQSCLTLFKINDFDINTSTLIVDKYEIYIHNEVHNEWNESGVYHINSKFNKEEFLCYVNDCTEITEKEFYDYMTIYNSIKEFSENILKNVFKK